MKIEDFTYILHHLGEEDTPFGAVSPPIFQTSNFSFKSFDEFQDALSQEDRTYLYTRGNNPIVRLVERKVSQLEGGEDARLFASGVSAIAASVMAFVKSGDHIISISDVYGGAKKLFDEYLTRFGITTTYIDGTRIEELEKAIKSNTKIIYLESPTTFTFKLQDLKTFADIAKKYHIRTIIDNSWATPYFQNPIDLGIDLVIHSASKYLGGHSDIMSGVVVGKREDIKHIFESESLKIGGTPDPFAAWLLLRGLRTLHIRMERHFESALKVANYFLEHPKVEDVFYPLLPSHPQYNLAKKQMKGGSSLFSVRLKTRNISKIKVFVDNLHYFKKAVSWGGYGSLVEPYIVIPNETNIEESFISLVRFYIGLESPDLLLNDLEDAFKLL